MENDQSTFLTKPQPCIYLWEPDGRVALEGTEKGKGEGEPPDFHFTPALRSWRTASLMNGVVFQGLRHSSLLPQWETSQACRPLKPVPSHQSVTLCAFSFPRTCRQKTTQACSPCKTASHLDLLALLLSPSLPYPLTLLLDILSCGSWIQDPLNQLCSRLWGTCFLLTLHLYLTP